jgi:hypothetical protein
MANYVSKTGVWDVNGDKTELPILAVENLSVGKTVKVTCQFLGRTLSDDLGDGYGYQILETNGALITLTPNIGLIQGSDSWQLFTHIVLYEVPYSAEKAEFKLAISRDEMNGRGVMMNFMLMAEVID